MMKKKFLLMAAAVMAAAVLGGCGGKTAGTGDDADTKAGSVQESADAQNGAGAQENGGAQDSDAQDNAGAQEDADAQDNDAQGDAGEQGSAGANIAADGLLAEIQEKGVLTIAMEGTWSPWTYHDESDALVGFDVEIGQYIADQLGVEAEFVEGEWDGLFAGLDAGRYDLVINGVDITDERSEKYDFSDPYAYIHTVLVVRSDNEDIHSFEDLNGKTTSNSIGSTYMELAESCGATVEGVDSLGETMQMVLSGRVDATLNAEVSVLDYLSQHPEAELKQVAATEEANHVAIPMRKGDETIALREAVNMAIQSMRDDGTLKALSEKYFGSDITQQ